MPSEKLTRILKAKSDFTSEEIAQMSERQGWAWVYANKPPPTKRLPEICFTGFSNTDKQQLVEAAQSSGWLQVVGSVTHNLEFLCTGDNAGPAKLARAREQGVCLLTRAEFEHMLKTGEIPQPTTTD